MVTVVPIRAPSSAAPSYKTSNYHRTDSMHLRELRDNDLDDGHG